MILNEKKKKCNAKNHSRCKQVRNVVSVNVIHTYPVLKCILNNRVLQYNSINDV